MSDTPTRPAAPPDVVSETHSGAEEGTGGHAAPAPNADRPTTRLQVVPGIEALPRLGDYRVVRKIGEGAMGSVYLAEDTRLGRRLAIKTMRPELAANQADRDRFVREARAAAAVEHDNIVPVWQVGEAADGTPFIAMPFLQGESLDSRLRREPIAPPELLVKVAADVAEGLAAAHAAGLIHRDIKPANIWLEGDLTAPDPAKRMRRAKLLDFGLARSVDQSDMQLTTPGAVMGTPAYMSPEQARGEHVDARADLFGLGATLYRMATGKFPFEGSTPIAVLIAVSTDTPRPVRELAPDLPLPLADLIERLMDKDAGARPQSAEEVSELVRALGESPGNASRPFGAVSHTESISKLFPPLAEEYPEQAPRRRSRWPRALAVACLLALVPLGLWAAGLFDHKKPIPEVTEVKTAPGSEGSTVEPPEPRVVPKMVEPKPVEPPKIDSPRVEAQVAPEPRVVAEVVEPKRVEALVAPEPRIVPVLVAPEQVEVLVAPPPRIVPEFDADRAAALWVLNAGGTVRVDTSKTEVKSPSGLPHQPFKLTAIALTKPVKDADLAAVAGCAELTGANLAGTRITDAGLAHLKGCKGLTALDLSGTRVTDESAAVLKRFTKLTNLSLGAVPIGEKGLKEIAEALPACRIQWADRTAAEFVLSVGGTVRVSGTDKEVRSAADLPRAFRLHVVDLTENKQVTGGALAALEGCPDLRSLRLSKVRVGDANLAVFKDSKSLTELDLRNTPIGDAGLAHFAGTKLTILLLSGTKVTDAGLAHFKDCKGLTELALSETKVSDAGLAHFDGCKALLKLDLSATRVSDAGVGAFADCKGLVSLQLGWTKMTDAGLAHFKGCKNLEQLQLNFLAVSETGLVHFKDCKKLKDLDLSETQVTDAGLAHFKGCKSLENLRLSGTKVTDAGLAHFKDCKEFRFVTLDRTKVGDAGLAHLAGCKNLTYLWLVGTEVTDAGLAHVKQSAALAHLHLERTKVTAKGVADLQKVLPKCQIKWDDPAKSEKK